MQNDNRLFEDLSKVATAAMGTLAGAGREFSDLARERMKDFVGSGEIARDEFDAVKANAVAAREAVEQLKAEVAALRAEIAALRAAPAAEKPVRARKAAAKGA
jgi:BMFP domain-containing protein YqiC